MELPPAGSPILSVLIPAYNEERLLGAVLERVRACFETAGFPSYEIVVCDNNSTDATAEVARANGARVVHEPHNQISRARNSAARAAQGKWLIFLDADTLLSPELLRATLACFESGTVCGGGAVLSFDIANIGPFATGLTALWNNISTIFGLAAGSYVFCTKIGWEAVGGFDQDVYAGEEIIFSRKLKAWGKPQGQRFRILRGAPVITSARKVEWYGQWQLLGRCLMMMRPGAVRRREACSLWYTRPDVPNEADV